MHERGWDLYRQVVPLVYVWIAGDLNIALALEQIGIIAGSPHRNISESWYLRWMENKTSRFQRLYMVKAVTIHSKKNNRLIMLRFSVADKNHYNQHRVSFTFRPQTRKSANKHDKTLEEVQSIGSSTPPNSQNRISKQMQTLSLMQTSMNTKRQPWDSMGTAQA